MTTPHQHFHEARQRELLREKAVFDLFSTLAQARDALPEGDLKQRCSAALLAGHLAFNGRIHFEDLKNDRLMVVGGKR